MDQRSYHGGAAVYHTEVQYLKGGNVFKRDAPETADSLAEANKNFQRSIRLAYSEDYGQDEVWVHLFKFGKQMKFKQLKKNPGRGGRENPSSEVNEHYKGHHIHGFFSDGKWLVWVDSGQYQFGDKQPRGKAAVIKKLKHYIDYKFYGVRSNPGESADSISKGFHGRPIGERFEVEEEELYPNDLAVIGCLVELCIISGGHEIPIRGFKNPYSLGYKEGDEVYVAAADRHNLEFIGGDQEIVNAKTIAGYTDKTLVRLGKVKDIVYLADKHHLVGSNGKEEEYEHSFGRKKYFLFGKQTEQPDLLYDVLNKTMKLVGGSYTIEDEGIKN